MLWGSLPSRSGWMCSKLSSLTRWMALRDGSGRVRLYCFSAFSHTRHCVANAPPASQEGHGKAHAQVTDASGQTRPSTKTDIHILYKLVGWCSGHPCELAEGAYRCARAGGARTRSPCRARPGAWCRSAPSEASSPPACSPATPQRASRGTTGLGTAIGRRHITLSSNRISLMPCAHVATTHTSMRTISNPTSRARGV